jgi:hypothetical protein
MSQANVRSNSITIFMYNPIQKLCNKKIYHCAMNNHHTYLLQYFNMHLYVFIRLYEK